MHHILASASILFNFLSSYAMAKSEAQGTVARWASMKLSVLLRVRSGENHPPMIHAQHGDGTATFTNRHNVMHFEQLRDALKLHGWIVVKNETSVSSRIPQTEVAYNDVSRPALQPFD